MHYSTYTLQPHDVVAETYLSSVARLADDVLAEGDAVRPIVDAYGSFVSQSGQEARRSHAEYLVEMLLLGVLWLARGQEATAEELPARTHLVAEIVRERRGGAPRRRDGSTAPLVSCGAASAPPRPHPTLLDLARLRDWLLATGEYDDELNRLDGWVQFLQSKPELADERLRTIARFAADFERRSERPLGRCTSQVDSFLANVLPKRGAREDVVQCSRRRIEYHFNMVGAEILNRAWRQAFLACRRHVVVLPGCARRKPHSLCKALKSETELRCTHCTRGCAVSEATRIAHEEGAQALAVVHGSDFSRFLCSPALQGGDVAIVGVACVPGLVGAGWRARAQGLAAQCVLLNASGCEHWLTTAVPTSLDLHELARILSAVDNDSGTPSLRNGNADDRPRAAISRRPSSLRSESKAQFQ